MVKPSIRLLHLEDNPQDAELLHATLAAAGLNLDTLRVESESAFREALTSTFDLIISDYSLPGFNGKHALAVAMEQQPATPFIFVSGTIGEETAIESLRSGATDYVLKHRLGRLVPAVQRALREAEERKARQEAERRLDRTLAELRELFQNLDDVVFSLDARTGKLIQISPACERVYGLSEKTLFESTDFWMNVATSEDYATVLSAQANLQRRENASFECRITHPNGTVRWVYAKMKPISGPDGTIARIDGIVSDITERKDLEARFLRAQRMENLGSLAGGIVHDLNNVLSPIVMGTQLLRYKYDDPSTLNTLNTLESCAKRGANLVKQILTFARGAEVRRVPVQPERVVLDVKKILEQTLPKSIRFFTPIAPNVDAISADRTQLDQVLMNLCINARDAMPDGGTLTVAVRNQTPVHEGDASSQSDGPSVVIEVSDTGAGIPADSLEKIFDPFFTTKEAGGGTGLGLSTVSAIVKNHNGFVTVDSTVGLGTTFRVHIPALVRDSQKEETVIGSEFPVGSGELILIVDDEAALRDITSTILQTYGYRVLVASDGTEGVAVYSQHTAEIRAVVTDYDMPRMDGSHMLRLLGQMNPGLRAISTSGLIDPDTFGSKPGPLLETLQKPFAPAQLLRALRRILDA